MVIEAHNLTKKDELIATFYTLRGGLSVISEQTETIRHAEEKLKKLEDKNTINNIQVNTEYNEKVYENKRILEEQPERRKYAEEREKKLKCNASYESDREISSYQLELSNVDKHKASALGGVLVGLAIVVVGLIISTILTVAFDATWPIGIAIVTTYVLPFVFGSRYRKKVTEREKLAMRTEINKKIKKENDKLRKIIEKIEQDKEDTFADIERTEKESAENIVKAEKEKDDNLDMYLPDIQKCRAKLNVDIVPVATSIAKSVRKSMLEICENIITESDWANIDLLIFYLETGRADSLKEALQLVDRQRQTDQISFAVEEGTMHICATIGKSTDRLSSAISSGFVRITDQLQFNHNEAMNTMRNSFSHLEGSIVNSLGKMESSINLANKDISERISGFNDTMKKEMGKIANVEYLQASLLNNVSKNSDELVRELKYNQNYWNV